MRPNASMGVKGLNSVLNLRELIFHEIIVTRASIYLLHETVSNYANAFFHDFDILANKTENKKPDIRYIYSDNKYLSY